MGLIRKYAALMSCPLFAEVTAALETIYPFNLLKTLSDWKHESRGCNISGVDSFEMYYNPSRQEVLENPQEGSLDGKNVTFEELQQKTPWLRL